MEQLQNGTPEKREAWRRGHNRWPWDLPRLDEVCAGCNRYKLFPAMGAAYCGNVMCEMGTAEMAARKANVDGVAD